ncbi:hypothetical protein BH23ACT10_BH23ACT10_40270 [soil metagenome]
MPPTEKELLGLAVERLNDVLPPGWSVRTVNTVSDRLFDAVVEVGSGVGPDAVLVADVKTLFRPRDVEYTVRQLQQSAATIDDAAAAMPLLVARYLSPSARERIAAMGACYIDATGNIRVVSSDPALAVLVSGQDSDPWRGPGRPRATLTGAPAARVVRALVDIEPPYSVPELIEASGASTGATYRVVKFLDAETLLERDDDGRIVTVAWQRLLRRWATDYGVTRADAVRRYLEPRGIDATLARLREIDDDQYVITGSVAAQLDAAYAPPRLLAVYLRDARVAEDVLQLRPVEQGTNVLVAVNDDSFAFERARTAEGLRYAAVSQVVVDLLDLPGRSPSEAEALLDWMGADDAWRD